MTRPSDRWIRLRAVWLLAILFFWFARPTPMLLAAGALVALVGLAVRAWAAGFIQKDTELATDGPYAFTRNPLYLGSLLLGLGAVLAGGSWIFGVVFIAFFALVYGRTMKREEALLEELFGDRYRRYASSVPLLAPRMPRYRPAEPTDAARFSAARYWSHREYHALLGTLAGFALLAVKLFWLSGR
jgi:protein-S-isoprenylcysteine O-methyltransferase Ste14